MNPLYLSNGTYGLTVRENLIDEGYSYGLISLWHKGVLRWTGCALSSLDHGKPDDSIKFIKGDAPVTVSSAHDMLDTAPVSKCTVDSVDYYLTTVDTHVVLWAQLPTGLRLLLLCLTSHGIYRYRYVLSVLGLPIDEQGRLQIMRETS